MDAQMTLGEAREALASVADDLGVAVGGTTRGKFGGDVLILNLAYQPADYAVSWGVHGPVKPPQEAARLIRARAKQKGTSLRRAANEWLDAQTTTPGMIADSALVEPLGEGAGRIEYWRSAEGQAELVTAAAAEGVVTELGRFGDEGYERVSIVPVTVSAPMHHLLVRYQRQVLAALDDAPDVRIVPAREAMRTEFAAEAVRLGATVHAEGSALVASWPEAAGQTASVTLSVVGEQLALTETAAVRVPDGFPHEWVERFGHRSAVVGRLREHLRMVERVTGVPMLAPPEPLKVVAA